jgi:hypothetical protein
MPKTKKTGRTNPPSGPRCSVCEEPFGRHLFNCPRKIEASRRERLPGETHLRPKFPPEPEEIRDPLIPLGKGVPRQITIALSPMQRDRVNVLHERLRLENEQLKAEVGRLSYAQPRPHLRALLDAFRALYYGSGAIPQGIMLRHEIFDALVAEIGADAALPETRVQGVLIKRGPR